MKLHLLILTSLVAFTACGNKSSGNNSESSANYVSGNLTGKYKAYLRPINTQANGFLPSGAAEIKAVSDALEVKTYLDDDTQVVHIQDIHAGTRCPTIADDLNGDGLLTFRKPSMLWVRRLLLWMEI